jgi:hypothetical protein
MRKKIRQTGKVFFRGLKISSCKVFKHLSQVNVHTICPLRKTKEKAFIFAPPKI